MDTNADRLGNELAVEGEYFSLDHVVATLKLDADTMKGVLSAAMKAGDFAFCLQTGFALGRLYERSLKVH